MIDTSPLSRRSLDRLRERGLVIFDEARFPPNHITYPNGYAIEKPTAAGGNGCASYEGVACPPHTEDEDEWVVVDAPPLKVCQRTDGLWYVILDLYAPGPGPSDFTERFDTEDAAVERVLAFYFDADDERFTRWASVTAARAL